MAALRAGSAEPDAESPQIGGRGARARHNCKVVRDQPAPKPPSALQRFAHPGAHVVREAVESHAKEEDVATYSAVSPAHRLISSLSAGQARNQF